MVMASFVGFTIFSLDFTLGSLIRCNPSMNKHMPEGAKTRSSGPDCAVEQYKPSSPSQKTLPVDISIDHEQRPALSELVGDNETKITGDVQFLLDFAIIGHAKTGTTTLMKRLAAHEEVQMYESEIRSLQNNEPAELVSLMYALPPGNQYKRGYKSPRDIHLVGSLQALQTYWPETKLIVGVRHPVKWFAAFYNYRLRIGHGLSPAETMVGKKLPRDVRFHWNLAQMGKTSPLDDPKQLKLLGLQNKTKTVEFTPLAMTNKIFLYDVSQPFDSNRTRAEHYTRDLSNFLGLSKPLIPSTVKERHKKTMNICDDKYSELRSELMEIGKNASEWIRKYFLENPDVVVSSPDHFKDILKMWRLDPCNSHQ